MNSRVGRRGLWPHGQTQDQIKRSEQLHAAVGHIQLRRGTTDEAQAMVRTAQDWVQRMGAHSAMEAFTQPSSPFLDRDLYLFVIDHAGHYVVHTANPTMVGQHISNLPGFDAPSFMEDCMHRVTQGEGWVEYLSTRPDTGEIRTKASFVVPLSDSAFMGCGAYLSTHHTPGNTLTPQQ